MKVQFNLLPDVKQNYIKAQSTKRTVTAIAILVAAACAAIFIIMLGVVYGVNKLQLSKADSNINKYKQQISSIPDINKILTVQNQLTSLSNLHQNKHITSRLFGYVTELTPTSVKIGQLQMDLTQNTMEIQGTADTQKSINTFIDTLKFTTYSLNGQDTGKNAFPSVIESSFGITKTGASYTLDIQFDPALFLNSDNVTLKVPAGVTTRSVLDDPNALFNGDTGNNNSTGGP